MNEDARSWYDQVMDPNNNDREAIRHWLKCCKDAIDPMLWPSLEKDLRGGQQECVSAFTELVAMRIFEAHVRGRASRSGRAKGVLTPDWILELEPRKVAVECTAKFKYGDKERRYHQQAKELIEEWVRENLADANQCTYSISRGIKPDRLQAELARSENILDIRRQQASIRSRERSRAELRLECGSGGQDGSSSCPITIELDFSAKDDRSKSVEFLESSCEWISDIIKAPIKRIDEKFKKYKDENLDIVLFMNDQSGDYPGKFPDIVLGPSQMLVMPDQSFRQVRDLSSSVVTKSMPENFLGIIFVSSWKPWHVASPSAYVYARSPRLKTLIEDVTKSALLSIPGLESFDLYTCPDLVTCAGMWEDWPFPTGSTT